MTEKRKSEIDESKSSHENGGRGITVNIFKKYPQGFRSLFLTQAFFNFSFYGLKSIFLLYAISQLSLSEPEAIGLFATLMALSYGTSLIGGWVADNRLGTKTTIMVGGLLQATGIFFLMFPLENLCFFALAFMSFPFLSSCKTSTDNSYGFAPLCM